MRHVVVAVQNHAGIGGVCQKQSRQTDLRLGRQRQPAASRRRAIPSSRRHRNGHRALSWRRACLDRITFGAVDFTVSTVPTIQPQIQSDMARGLAVTRGRTPLLPGIPSMEELGYRKRRRDKRDGAGGAGRDAGADRRETPSPLSGRGQRSGIQGVLIQRGFQPIGTTTEEFRDHIDREIAKWARLLPPET